MVAERKKERERERMGSELVWRWCVAGNGLMRCFYNNNTAIAKASSLYLSSPKPKPKFSILTPVPPLALVRITRSSFSLNLGQGYSSSSSSSSSNENNNNNINEKKKKGGREYLEMTEQELMRDTESARWTHSRHRVQVVNTATSLSQR